MRSKILKLVNGFQIFNFFLLTPHHPLEAVYLLEIKRDIFDAESFFNLIKFIYFLFLSNYVTFIHKAIGQRKCYRLNRFPIKMRLRGNCVLISILTSFLMHFIHHLLLKPIFIAKV